MIIKVHFLHYEKTHYPVLPLPIPLVPHPRVTNVPLFLLCSREHDSMQLVKRQIRHSYGHHNLTTQPVLHFPKIFAEVPQLTYYTKNAPKLVQESSPRSNKYKTSQSWVFNISTSQS
jgi:hypothetical protein